MEEHDNNVNIFKSRLKYFHKEMRFIDAISDEDGREMLRKNAQEKAVEVRNLVEKLEWIAWDMWDTSKRNQEWLDSLESAPIDYQLEAAVHVGNHKAVLESILDLVRAVDPEQGLKESDPKGYVKWAEKFPDCCPWPKCKDHCPEGE